MLMVRFSYFSKKIYVVDTHEDMLLVLMAIMNTTLLPLYNMVRYNIVLYI